jgi:hypothetical protein
MERGDWALLAVGYSPDDRLTPVQVQKSLFLLGQNYRRSLGSYYRFVPYSYGPFDAKIYSDLEGLAKRGFIELSAVPGQRWSEYALTAAGKAQVRRIGREAPKNSADYLEKAVKWARKLTFSQLVRAIYEHYPSYRKNSVFQF